ncbi:MAG: hypothetical protein QM703_06670 [Gemmatales bacterium]
MKNGSIGHEANEIQILELKSGTIRYRLISPKEMDHWVSNRGSFGPRIIAQSLWWFTQREDQGLTHWKLHRWRFSEETEERVIKEWRIPTSSPFEVAWAPGGAPYFLSYRVLPWESGLATLASDGWTGLANILLHGQVPNYSAVHIPWIETFHIPSENNQTIQPLASWVIPALRWKTTFLTGTDLRWLAFGDSPSPSEMIAKGIDEFLSPCGVMLYDGHTGQPRKLSGIPPNPRENYLIESFGDLLRLKKYMNQSEYLLFDGTTGQQVSWPQELTQPTDITKFIQDMNDPSIFGYHEDGQYFQLTRTEAGLSCFATTLREEDRQIKKYWPIELQSNVMMYRVLLDEPEFFKWLAERWEWFRTWLFANRISTRFGVAFVDTQSGKRLHLLKDTINAPMLSQTHRHLYTWGIEKDKTYSFEAWALPSRFYSAWWSRGAGLLVFVAILMLRRNR